MANLTKKALRYEIWAMLPDECKKIMESIKESYLDSMMADAESFSNGQMLKFLQDEYGCNGIVSIEWAATKKRQLKVEFKGGKPMLFKNYSAIVEFIRSESNQKEELEPFCPRCYCHPCECP